VKGELYDQRMLLRRLLLGALALATLAVAGCSSDGSTDPAAPLPDGAALLRDATATMRGISSAHFGLRTEGEVSGLSVQSLEGDVTTEGGPSGAAKGSGTMTVGGQLVEVEFVLVDETLYLKGPTGGFQKLPAALGASVYDPSAVLDPERGIAKVLAGVRNPVTEAREELDGTPAYKVTGTVTGETLAGILPGAPAETHIALWLAEDAGHRPLRASVALPEGAKVEVTLSDVDKTVTVTAPA
jgi:lipoprotein LprG